MHVMESERRMTSIIPVEKDEEDEHPVPTIWRDSLSAAADALAAGNYTLTGVSLVQPLDDETAAYIKDSIADYGCTLIPLPEQSWDTSISSWQLDHWDVLVDLFTREEGRSDLVMQVTVVEDGPGFLFNVHLVYVP
jgi:hypothetical protein